MGKVRKLMNEIKTLDIEPSVFRVNLLAWDYCDGFTASVVFRQGHDCGDGPIRTAKGATPRAALMALLDKLLEGKYDGTL